MNKEEIIASLEQNHVLFIEYLTQLSKQDFELSNNGKWNAGQQLLHIYMSVKPLANGLKSAPKFVIKTTYGKAKNNPKTYDELVKSYHETLAVTDTSNSDYQPKDVIFSEKDEIIKKLKYVVDMLIRALSKFTDKELNTLRLPHPLLGKICIREMLYFTSYHVKHHHDITHENLKESHG